MAKILLIAVMLTAVVPTAGAAELLVFAAASLADVMKEVRVLYEAGSADRIVYSFDASSNLARQIVEGAPADVFISADEAKMDGLAEKKLILDGTRRSVLSNSMVVVAFRGTFTLGSPEQLLEPPIERIALANPSVVPAGIYARSFLENKGLWKRLSGKVVPLDNVRSALAAVESGNADVGFVFRTDASLSKKVEVIYELPSADCPSMTYPMAVMRGSGRKEAAQRFLEFLESATAAEVLEKFGFDVLNQ